VLTLGISFGALRNRSQKRKGKQSQKMLIVVDWSVMCRASSICRTLNADLSSFSAILFLNLDREYWHLLLVGLNIFDNLSETIAASRESILGAKIFLILVD
jgi:hypothetical protein